MHRSVLPKTLKSINAAYRNRESINVATLNTARNFEKSMKRSALPETLKSFNVALHIARNSEIKHRTAWYCQGGNRNF
jgi:hypothetical protein